MDEEEHPEAAQASPDDPTNSDEAVDMNGPPGIKELDSASNPFMNGEIRTLDGEVAGDEFAADAINYQVLLGKIDKLLEKLKLDA